jgi:hypothetical protein
LAGKWNLLDHVLPEELANSIDLSSVDNVLDELSYDGAFVIHLALLQLR